jgi:hypothetical protein
VPLHPCEGSCGHEASHHAIVLELVPDGVCVVQAGFFEKPPDVVCRQPRMCWRS